MQDIIQLKDVVFHWDAKKAPTIQIDELTIVQGQHTFIKGPSGCGKSTLLGLLTGINQAQSGKISILGQNLSHLKASKRDRFRADHIGYIFQQFNLLPYLSVIDNVLLPCQFSKYRESNTPAPMQDKARELLSSLKLPSELFEQPVIELSIGQQQRVAAARALIGMPELIIADEPTSALDHDNRKVFIELLMEEAQKAESTLVFVSHDPTLEPLFKRSINLMDINQAGRKS
ncbi:ABC transporter ATP-binding protein [Vibrio maerlii]|uniref:ABC transporter ATP-binding protein n=1 Tax=Vibrio maerlii TaxID=2231648 RepID=UPI001F1327A2|nr:ABC transporter ATP-binding protein [Vibrio maerlii]